MGLGSVAVPAPVVSSTDATLGAATIIAAPATAPAPVRNWRRLLPSSAAAAAGPPLAAGVSFFISVSNPRSNVAQVNCVRNVTRRTRKLTCLSAMYSHLRRLRDWYRWEAAAPSNHPLAGASSEAPAGGLVQRGQEWAQRVLGSGLQGVEPGF